MFNAEDEEDLYCVYIQRWLPKPCEVEICTGYEDCPYINKEYVKNDGSSKTIPKDTKS